MKLKNSNIGKAQLRREQFNRSQTKSQFKGKKSLSRRIIAERVGGITKDNVDYEIERLGCMVEIEELVATIVYHLKFGWDTRPSIFNEDMIFAIWDKIKDLQIEFDKGIITSKEHLECLEEIDTQIMEFIDNRTQVL